VTLAPPREAAVLDLGAVTVQRIVELDRWVFPPKLLFPAITPDLVQEARESFDDRSFDPVTGEFILSVHSYLVRTARRTVLIDCCNGNDKPRPAFPGVDQLQTKYLERLSAAGVRREEVDLVLCTHLHPDHVGWNTRLVDGRWAPTFPNARYLIGRLEFEDMEDWYAHGERTVAPDHDLSAAWEDSVLPVVANRQADFIELGHVVEHELDHAIRLDSTPGHTRGHQAVHIEGTRTRAVATGDAFHHLLQLNHPELPQGADRDVVASTRTRRRLFGALADTDTIVLPGHFPAPTAGRIVSAPRGLRFQFL
jgi:glyoxylase-like metal-dependent hydrolase (beta-lactamase superfamily II)